MSEILKKPPPDWPATLTAYLEALEARIDALRPGPWVKAHPGHAVKVVSLRRAIPRQIVRLQFTIAGSAGDATLVADTQNNDLVQNSTGIAMRLEPTSDAGVVDLQLMPGAAAVRLVGGPEPFPV